MTTLNQKILKLQSDKSLVVRRLPTVDTTYCSCQVACACHTVCSCQSQCSCQANCVCQVNCVCEFV